jgi:hypothetical protein
LFFLFAFFLVLFVIDPFFFLSDFYILYGYEFELKLVSVYIAEPGACDLYFVVVALFEFGGGGLVEFVDDAVLQFFDYFVILLLFPADRCDLEILPVAGAFWGGVLFLEAGVVLILVFL